MRSIRDYFSAISEANGNNQNGNEDDDSNHEKDQIEENDNSIVDGKIKIIRRNTENKKYNEGKESRNHTFCKNLVIIGGVSYDCHYHNRLSRFDVNHDCSKHIKQDNANIEDFFTSQTSLKYLDTSKLSLEDHVALVYAQLNFSIKSMCSPEFNDLLYHFIRVGQDSTKFNTRPPVSSLYKAKDRFQLRMKIINLSQGSLLTQCQLASISCPLSAALDGGTVAHNHFVDVLLNDILFKSGTFLFETFTLPSFNAKTYLNIGKQVIDKALMNGIDIVLCWRSPPFSNKRIRSS